MVRIKSRERKMAANMSVATATCQWTSSVLIDTLPWVGTSLVWAYLLMISREAADWKDLVRRCVDDRRSTDNAVIRRIYSLMPPFEKSESQCRFSSSIALPLHTGSIGRAGVPSEWQECTPGTLFALPARFRKPPRTESYCRCRPARLAKPHKSGGRR